jgi:hypothetical protein
MNRVKSNIVIILILLVSGFMWNSVALGQKAEISVINDSVQIDKSKVSVEKVPWGKINQYKGQKAFNYKIKKRLGYDLWSRLMSRLYDILEAIFSKKGVAPYLRLLFIMLIIASVVYLIIKADISGIFSKNRKTKNVNGFDYFDEDIHSQDLDKKLSQAIANADYRKAIRFYYLILLKQLDLSGLIEWKISKTNFDYLAELADNQILSDFKVLSGIYEYTWYGNFEVGQSHFQNWQSDFQMAIKQINQK